MHSTLPLALALLGTAAAQSPPNFEPSTENPLSLSFNGVSITSGQRIPVTLPRGVPVLTLPSSLPSDGTYLLLTVDPDAPSPLAPGPQAQILHFLSPSVRASSNSTLTSDVMPIAPYAPPAPPSVEPHRYIFYLFNQPEKDFTLPAGFENFSSENRRSFNAERFAEAAGLGEPVAATYFLAGNDTAGGNGTAGPTGTGAPTGGLPITPTGTGAPIATGAAARVGMVGWGAMVGVVGAAFGALM